MVDRFTAQRVHLRRDGEQEGSFPGQYMSGQLKMGSKEALDKVARTSSRHHEGVIMWGMPLEWVKTSSPSLKRRVQLGPMHAYTR